MSKQIDSNTGVDKVRVQFESPKDLDSRLENYSENNGISKSGAIRMLLNQNLPQEEE